MRILVVKMSSLGDIVHAFPVLEYLKKCHPESQIDWVVEQPFAELVCAHPMVNQIIPVQTKKWRSHLLDLSTWKEFARFRHELQKITYDFVLDLQGNSKSGLVTFFAKSEKKVGFDYSSVPEWPNILATNKRFSPPSGRNIREDYLFLAQCATEGLSEQTVLARISPKLSENSNDLSCDLHRESLSPYRLDNDLERIFDKSHTTFHPTFSRFCEKCGLACISPKLSKNSNDLSCDLHRESLLPYRLDSDLERIPDASRTTSHPTFSRFCEKYGLEGVKLHLSEKDSMLLKKVLDQIKEMKGLKVLVCSGSNWANKQLSKKTLKDFLQIFSERLNVHLLLVWGNQKEKAIAEEIMFALPQNCSILNRLSLPALQNLMTHVDLVLAMDSLPLHLAGISSTPTYSVFGPSSAIKYKPIGYNHEAFQGSCPYGKTFEKRCDILRSCKTGACMKQLQGEKMFEHFHVWWRSIN